MTARALLLCCLLCAASSAAAQEPPPPAPPPKPAWPELPAAEAETAKLRLRRLDAAEAEVAAAAEAELVAMGAGVAPLLLSQLGNRRPTAPEALRRILHRVVEPVHAPLVAERADSKAPLLREWSVEFLALQHDGRWREVLARAFEAEDRELRFRAALGLAALGDQDALATVFAQCQEQEWRDHAELVQRALAPARSSEMAEWLVRHMPRDDERARITGLRLMRALAPKEYAGVVATYLDAEQHAVKKEAINTLRAVVDGAAPLENLSVFQAIDQAKKWKERIR
jgi:hypothetical protein